MPLSIWGYAMGYSLLSVNTPIVKLSVLCTLIGDIMADGDARLGQLSS